MTLPILCLKFLRSFSALSYSRQLHHIKAMTKSDISSRLIHDLKPMAKPDLAAQYLQKLFEFEEINQDHFRANYLGPPALMTSSVYGGLLFAQALAVAEQTVSDIFLPHATHSFFILNVTADKPVDYHVQRIRDGRSFCTRFVTAHQEDKIVFSIQLSFHIKEETSIEHQIKMPEVPAPESLKNTWDLANEFIDLGKQGKLTLAPFQKVDMKGKLREEPTCLFEIRPTDPEKTFALKEWKPESIYYWVKSRIPLSDSRTQHRHMAAYITDASLVGAANRPHMSHGYIPSMLFSLDHSVWFHDDDFRADEWLLYENYSPMA
uniref:Acyl-CoA thioesterase II n=1 Tax=Acrobeloides nanus TaxID=290746 RepID=A0A914CYP4_9BILA